MLEGVFTAIVTPYRADGQVDFAGLSHLVERQIAAGVDGIVPVGTTGESPTLDVHEHLQVIREVARRCSGQCKVVAGTGANSTAEAVELTKAAADMGCDATLQVTPYYNKPNDAGLRKHFEAVADLGLPVMLYNIPGRTGRPLSVDLVAGLAEHPHIVAIKEAGGNPLRVSEYRAVCDLAVLSGDDPLTLAMMVLGGVGVVSVASNVIPEVMVQMVRHAAAGQFDAARDLHDQWLDLFQALLGLDTNPIPVKTALSMMGLTEELFRLPLDNMAPGPRETLYGILQGHGLV